MRVAVLFTTILLSIFLSPVYAEGSSVKVNINNTVNSTTNSDSSTSDTKAKIDIEQSGNGTSQVTVNGKEYKVEGVGELHIDENIPGNSQSTMDEEPGEVEITPPPTEEPEPSESPNPEFGETLTTTIDNFFESLQNLISDFFENF